MKRISLSCLILLMPVQALFANFISNTISCPINTIINNGYNTYIIRGILNLDIHQDHTASGLLHLLNYTLDGRDVNKKLSNVTWQDITNLPNTQDEQFNYYSMFTKDHAAFDYLVQNTKLIRVYSLFEENYGVSILQLLLDSSDNTLAGLVWIDSILHRCDLPLPKNINQ